MPETTDDQPLPDALQPRPYDSHHGRPESYWQRRNALVDAVKAAGASAPDAAHNVTAFSAWLRTPAGDAYRAALQTLKEFDAGNGGSPIL